MYRTPFLCDRSVSHSSAPSPTRGGRGRILLFGLLALAVLLPGCRGETETNSESQTATGSGSETSPSTASEPRTVDAFPEAPAIRPLPLSPSTDAETEEGQFVYLDAAVTGMDFTNTWEKSESTLHAVGTSYIASGVAIGDVDGDGLADVFLCRQSDGGRLYRNAGGMKFEDMTEAAGIDPAGMWSVGATFADINNDGHLDLYVCGYATANRLYLNDGKGTFTEKAAEYGLDYTGPSVCAAFGDYDNDGDLDVYLVTNRYDGHLLEELPGESPTLQDAQGNLVINPKFRERYYLMQHPERGVVAEPGGAFDHLFRNDGDRFIDVTKESNIGELAYMGLSANWWDYDGDGRLDLYVANDFKGEDLLYRNNGPNRDGVVTFSNALEASLPHTPWYSMGSDFTDINHDGLVDYLASDMAGTTHYRDKLSMGAMSGPDSEAWFLNWPTPPQYMRNCLFVNTGTPRFLEVAAMAGIASTDWTWTAKFDDLDNDGHEDVFFTNGMSRDTNNGDLRDQVRRERMEIDASLEFWWNQPRFELENMAFRGSGDMKFEDVSQAWGLDHLGVSTGAATGDLDRDGDLDMVINGFNEPVRVYRNDLADGRAIQFQLKGSVSNRFGLGSRIDVRVSDEAPVQTKWLATGRGFASSSELVVHFGTGEAERIEQVRVTWPSGVVQVFEDLATGSRYEIVEKGTLPDSTSLTDSRTPDGEPALFESVDTFRNMQHIEKPYDDFQREPLLPNQLSQMGAGMAWGDVDGDGDDDLYFGQATDVAGQLYLRGEDDTFRLSRQQAFAADAQHEDMGSVFFDVDGDQDLDLYVVSGGVECEPGDARLADRLYLNDGTGNFSRAEASVLPEIRVSGSTVAAADFDGDGDVDLFVGSRFVPGAYPTTPESILWVNEGGTLKNAIEEVAPDLATTGMVTSALWADINDDNQLDLFVTIDWGAPELWLQRDGQLQDVTEAAGLADNSGWFNSVTAGDVDGDGDLDFALGNFGENTKYHASHKKPELLFYGDFEDNGKKQIVEAKYENGVCLPRRGLGCTSNAMPTIKEKLPTYHEFAISPLVDIYTESGLDDAERFEATYLESCLLINTGNTDGIPVFEFRELPPIVQAAPVFGCAFVDVNGDGNLDLYLLQNFHGPQRETGNMDGGVSVLLLGDGAGRFDTVWPNASGLVVDGDATSLSVVDLNGDQRPDFLAGVNNDRPVAHVNLSTNSMVAIRLTTAGPQPAWGAQATITTRDGNTRVIHLNGGGSYLGQGGNDLYTRNDVESIDVRWPDGTRETFSAVPAVDGRIVLTAGAGS